ncbi:MAG: GIY-YIG nuclease family protein [Proteobacteria bacterium]|nr:GIY-YIG nuclease family protein [Pseudomonadota bacterium]
MPYYIYILRNEESGTLYTCHTADLEKRLARHNDKSRITKRYTKKYEGNWVLVHSEEYATRSAAMQRESFLKSEQGRVWIEKNVDMGR